MTRTLKIILVVGVILTVLATGARVWMLKNHYQVIWGQSMYGSMTYISVVHYDNEVSLSEGDLACFMSPLGEQCVKHVLSVSTDGYWSWMIADNRGWNGQDSAEYGWVPKSSIFGKVNWRWPNRPIKRWLVQTKNGYNYYPQLALLNHEGHFFAWLASCSDDRGGELLNITRGRVVFIGKDYSVFWDECGIRRRVCPGNRFSISPDLSLMAVIRSAGLAVVDCRTGEDVLFIRQGGFPTWLGTILHYKVEVNEPGNWVMKKMRFGPVSARSRPFFLPEIVIKLTYD